MPHSEAEVLAWFDAEGVPPEARHLVQQASLRYRHQGFLCLPIMPSEHSADGDRRAK